MSGIERSVSFFYSHCKLVVVVVVGGGVAVVAVVVVVVVVAVVAPVPASVCRLFIAVSKLSVIKLP